MAGALGAWNSGEASERCRIGFFGAALGVERDDVFKNLLCGKIRTASRKQQRRPHPTLHEVWRRIPIRPMLVNGLIFDE